MRNFLTIIFLIPLTVHPQSSSFDFHSPENIRKFADHLFCEGDYLRAIEQYDLINQKLDNDTIKFKVMLGYSELGFFLESNEIFREINDKSNFYPDAYLLSFKNQLISEPGLINAQSIYSFNSLQLKSFSKLTNISMLYEDKFNISRENFISPFDAEELNSVSTFYDYKVEPPYKSPALAGLLSAVIPGSGKMYVDEWGDGITALVVTSLFAFLAYDNFRADHTTRAWIFTGLGVFFYAGNIYGSIASAQIFNARIDFVFNDGLKLFFKQQNYFLPEYDFCK
jgi:TM2 domain-containing membrane protein YozV